jgi:broad specificity phosphatase PhoE
MWVHLTVSLLPKSAVVFCNRLMFVSCNIGDIDPQEGIVHANCIANRLAMSGAAAPTMVYASPFLRTVHTAHIIATGCQVRIEQGLTEWQVPSLLVTPNGKHTVPKSPLQHSQQFDTVDANYTSVNPTVSFPETEQDLVARCAMTLDKLLLADSSTSIAIVSHAPCNIAMALHLEGVSLQDSKREPWPLGGLTLFSRPQEGGPWKLEFYGCSNHMPGDYQAGLKRWTLPSLQSSS